MLMTKYLIYSENTLTTLLKHIQQLDTAQQTNFICIWGASGSGKSTLTKHLAELTPDSAIFPIDHYLSASLKSDTYNHTSPNPETPYIEGLNPHIWDQLLLNEHLEKLQRYESIDMPIFDHKTRERNGHTIVAPHKIIFIEGAYALENVIDPIKAMVIILDAPFHDRFIRKLVRTARVTGRSDLDESIERYITKTEPSTSYYLKKYSIEADYVITIRSHPNIEFQDFASNPSAPPTHRIDLIPTPASGRMHEGELFYLTPTKNIGVMRLTYCINNQQIFKANVAEKIIKLLKLHYDLLQR